MLQLFMRFFLSRTDKTIGDVVVSLPVQKFLLDHYPSAQIFWLTRPETAPILNNIPGITAVLHRYPDSNLEQIINYVKPDILMNLGHRHREIIPAAKNAGVPMRIAIPRGFKQAFDATHRIWAKRSGSGRHESQLALDFLKPLGLFVSALLPPPPQLVLTPEEIALGQADIQRLPGSIPGSRLGVVVRGSGVGAFPSYHWWRKTLQALKDAGWNPIILSPPDESDLPSANIRGLMARLYACDVVLSVSTGPAHLAAALNLPTLCLMGRRIRHGPVRWAPLGNRVEILQYPGEEDDLGSGMDRLDAGNVLARLEKLR